MPRDSDASVIAILAAHNRCESTIRALTRLTECAASAHVAVRAVVVDDGSTDSTGACLRAIEGLDVRVVDGEGTWYWARSMARAEGDALGGSQGRDTWLLWLNDDVNLDPDALGRLVRTSQAHSGRIIIGSTRDPDTGAVTYGGLNRRGIHPLAYALVDPPSDAPCEVDTFNGNIVLVPSSVAVSLGGIDGDYAHGLADIDYGWRARAAGIPALLAPGTFGACARNTAPPAEPTMAAWRRFISPKGGGHPASSRRFLRKTHRITWPLWWLSTYVKWWLMRPTRARAKGGAA